VIAVHLSFLNDVEDEESGICATEYRNCQGQSTTEELQAQARILIRECGEEGVPDDEEWPTFFAALIFLDAPALTFKDGEHVVHESCSWADVVKGNECSP
jgi:hypothetical protein